MKKILLVDGTEVSRNFTQIILSTMYETICASTGAGAIELFRDESPDVVLSKTLLSDMTGEQLLRELQTQFGEVIPFVLTGIDNASDTESKALQSGAWDFIRVPFAPEILLCRLEKVLWFAEKLATP